MSSLRRRFSLHARVLLLTAALSHLGSASARAAPFSIGPQVVWSLLTSVNAGVSGAVDLSPCVGLDFGAQLDRERVNISEDQNWWWFKGDVHYIQAPMNVRLAPDPDLPSAYATLGVAPSLLVDAPTPKYYRDGVLFWTAGVGYRVSASERGHIDICADVQSSLTKLIRPSFSQSSNYDVRAFAVRLSVTALFDVGAAPADAVP